MLDVEELKELYEFRNKLTKEGISMIKPHITVKICDTKMEAQEYTNLINKKLPIEVTITGVTID